MKNHLSCGQRDKYGASVRSFISHKKLNKKESSDLPKSDIRDVTERLRFLIFVTPSSMVHIFKPF